MTANVKGRNGWSVETILDHIHSLMTESDKRYQQRFEASEKALDIGFSGQKSAVDAAFYAQKSAIDAAFSAQKEAINAALAAADRAVTKAELATEKRFENVNEFRGALDNQQRTLIPRSEVTVIQQALEARIAQLTKEIDALENVNRDRSAESVGVKGGWGYAVGVVGLVMLSIAVLAGLIALIAKLGG